VVGVGVHGGVVAAAQTEARLGLPAVGEAVDLGEFEGAVGMGEVREHPAGSDGVELVMVAGEQHLAAGVDDQPGNRVEVVSARHGGLIDDHQVAGSEVVAGSPGGRVGRERLRKRC